MRVKGMVNKQKNRFLFVSIQTVYVRVRAVQSIPFFLICSSGTAFV